MITLNKALKIKNRLIGEMTRLQILVRNRNCVRLDQKDDSINIADIWEQLQNVTNRLVELKSKIAVATSQIAPYLIDLAETKSYITFITSLPIKNGNEETVIGYGVNSSVKNVEWESFINEYQRQDIIKKNQEHIDNLQDKIDEFNAVTKIDFS